MFFKNIIMDKRILLIFFLVSGFAFSQTTVTLEDQCNCEVLSGTLVTTPGATTPTGADTGDLYVNTNTGSIFYWDGDSWEASSTNGIDGVGVQSTVDNFDGTFTINYTDGSSFTTSDFTGPIGPTGATGATGETGATGYTGDKGNTREKVKTWEEGEK